MASVVALVRVSGALVRVSRTTPKIRSRKNFIKDNLQ